MTTDDPAGQDDAPLLRVVRGTPSDDELAALAAVIAATAPDDTSTPEGPASAWSSRSGQIRRPLDHGPGAWRASGLPQ